MAEAPPKDAARKKAARSEDLRIKVAGGLKQRFKQAAKSAGVKKGVLLERLLAEWEARQPGVVTAPAPIADHAESGLRASAAAPGRQAKRPSRQA
jgi:hypothetical protein